jgi:hypothetical protein
MQTAEQQMIEQAEKAEVGAKWKRAEAGFYVGLARTRKLETARWLEGEARRLRAAARRFEAVAA